MTARRGIGGWSVDDIVAYLKTGHNKTARRHRPDGRNAQFVDFAHERRRSQGDCDLSEGSDRSGSRRTRRPGRSADDQDDEVGGAKIYADECSGCHAADGKGSPDLFPSLERLRRRCSKPIRRRCCMSSAGRAQRRHAAAPTAPAMPEFGWLLKTTKWPPSLPISATPGAIPRRRCRHTRSAKRGRLWSSAATESALRQHRSRRLGPIRHYHRAPKNREKRRNFIPLQLAFLIKIKGDGGDPRSIIIKITSFSLEPKAVRSGKWKARHSENGLWSMAAASITASMTSDMRVRSWSPCTDRVERQKFRSAGRIGPWTPAWCSAPARNWGSIQHICLGPRAASEAEVIVTFPIPTAAQRMRSRPEARRPEKYDSVLNALPAEAGQRLLIFRQNAENAAVGAVEKLLVLVGQWRMIVTGMLVLISHEFISIQWEPG